MSALVNIFGQGFPVEEIKESEKSISVQVRLQNTLKLPMQQAALLVYYDGYGTVLLLGDIEPGRDSSVPLKLHENKRIESIYGIWTETEHGNSHNRAAQQHLHVDSGGIKSLHLLWAEISIGSTPGRHRFLSIAS